MKNISELEPLFPFEAIDVPNSLKASIENHGVLLPFLVSGNRIIDGNKRYFILKELEKKEVRTVDCHGEPFEFHWLTNLFRTWNPVEIAMTFKNLPTEKQRDFCESMHINLSPNIQKAFDLVIDTPEIWPDLKENKISLSILRDLTYTGTNLNFYVSWLRKLNGTVAEKRLVASWIRQCSIRGTLPEKLDCIEFCEAKKILQGLTNPRQQKALERFSKTLSNISLPPDTKLEIDPTFEKPGITVQIRVKRNTLNNLELLKTSLERLFCSNDDL